MAFDWDDIEKEINEAAAETDVALESKISSLTNMNDEDINALFPEIADKEKLVKLMKIINQSASENEIKARLINNIEDLAGTAVKLLAKFV